MKTRMIIKKTLPVILSILLAFTLLPTRARADEPSGGVTKYEITFHANFKRGGKENEEVNKKVVTEEEWNSFTFPGQNSEGVVFDKTFMTKEDLYTLQGWSDTPAGAVKYEAGVGFAADEQHDDKDFYAVLWDWNQVLNVKAGDSATLTSLPTGWTAGSVEKTLIFRMDSSDNIMGNKTGKGFVDFKIGKGVVVLEVDLKGTVTANGSGGYEYTASTNSVKQMDFYVPADMTKSDTILMFDSMKTSLDGAKIGVKFNGKPACLSKDDKITLLHANALNGTVSQTTEIVVPEDIVTTDSVETNFTSDSNNLYATITKMPDSGTGGSGTGENGNGENGGSGQSTTGNGGQNGGNNDPQMASASAPVFNPDEATFAGDSLKVTLTSATQGAAIYYTTAAGTNTPDDPTSSSTKYVPGNAITITETTTIKAIAVAQGYKDSSIVMKTYTRKASGGNGENSGNQNENGGQNGGGSQNENGGQNGGGNQNENGGQNGGGNQNENGGQNGGGNQNENGGQNGGGNQNENGGQNGGGNQNENGGQNGSNNQNNGGNGGNQNGNGNNQNGGSNQNGNGGNQIPAPANDTPVDPTPDTAPTDPVPVETTTTSTDSTTGEKTTVTTQTVTTGDGTKVTKTETRISKDADGKTTGITKTSTVIDTEKKQEILISESADPRTGSVMEEKTVKDTVTGTSVTTIVSKTGGEVEGDTVTGGTVSTINVVRTSGTGETVMDTFEPVSPGSTDISLAGISGNADGEVVIPGHVEAADGTVYTVTKIDSKIFAGIKGVTDITIPGTVTHIGKGAFKNSGVKNISITVEEAGKLTIDKNAFKNMKDGTEVIITAKNKKQFNKIVAKMKKAGGTNLTYTFQKL